MNRWFSTELLAWYRQNQRDLPWRNTKDPYLIWLSEIILQQTQVAQGLAYYHKFADRFPTVVDLANAPEDEVLKLWQGLGYYSRARNLHFTAKQVVAEHKGIFPSQYPQILALKGIGDYTAAAIASFAYNAPHAVVDGNVYRVLSRIFGIATPIDSSAGKKEFQELAGTLLDKKQPALHNQAIMEFGSQYCRYVNPACDNCIFNNKCQAFKSGSVSSLPVKSKKTTIRKRFFNYIVLADNKGKVHLKKRQEKDIWKGLYEFCLIETDKMLSSKAFLNSGDFRKLCASDFDVLYTSKSYKHVLTHQHLHSKFYVINSNAPATEGYKKTNISQLSKFAFPRLIEKFMDDCDLKEIL